MAKHRATTISPIVKLQTSIKETAKEYNRTIKVAYYEKMYELAMRDNDPLGAFHAYSKLKSL